MKSRDILASEGSLQVETISFPPVLTIYPDVGQFSPFPRLCTTKHWVPRQLKRSNFQSINLSEIRCTNLIHLGRRWTKQFFNKADFLFIKKLSCPRLNLWNSQTLILDVVEIGSFLLEFSQQFHPKNADVPDIYFTLLDAASTSPTPILIQNAKTNGRGI